MSEPSLREQATRARGRLEELIAAGVMAFAPSALAFAEGLVARGEGMGGPAGRRLVARAEERAARLAKELDDAKARARAALGTMDDASGELGRAIDAGEVVRVLRAERARRSTASRPASHADAWTARLRAEAHTRGLDRAGDLRSPAALAAALYASSRAETSAMIVALRAQSEVSSHAGPYNPLAIAAFALAELSTLAPGYLTALVAYLDELSPLFALPSPASPSTERPRASQGPRGRRKAR
jgi:hypothetical protein